MHGANQSSAPKLRAVLARAAEGWELSDDESLLLFRGLHILGAARDQEAYQPLLRLLRRPFDEVDNLLGDAITENLAKIVTGMFDGDSEALLALIMDRSIDGFIREALLGAATFLTWERRIEGGRFREFLVRFHEERPAEDNNASWAGWVQVIALLGMRDLVPLAHGAFREGRISMNGPIAISSTTRSPKPNALPTTSRGSRKTTLVTSRTVSDIAGFFRQQRRGTRREAPWTDFESADEPVRNPWRHVGRNDPCPCGSGKKFKKCCLAKGGPPA